MDQVRTILTAKIKSYIYEKTLFNIISNLYAIHLLEGLITYDYVIASDVNSYRTFQEKAEILKNLKKLWPVK
jgi:hypothetical protein